MNTVVCATMCLFCFSICLHAQEYTSVQSISQEFRRTLFVEIGGASYGVGIGGEMTTPLQDVSYRVGIAGVLPGSDSAHVVSFPFGVHYLLGASEHRIDIGVGATYLLTYNNHSMPCGISPTMFLGYRFLPTYSGYTFSIGVAYPGYNNSIPIGVKYGVKF